MRITTLHRGVVLLAVIAIIVFGSIQTGKSRNQQSPGTSALTQRIERVENGLFLPIMLKGEASARMQNSQTMKVSLECGDLSRLLVQPAVRESAAISCSPRPR